MKHHIVITRGQFIVENMFSKIATSSELRARLAKRFPGKYALYFRTVDPRYGVFFVDGERYSWFIDSCNKPKLKKPKGLLEMRLVREPKAEISLLNATYNPYKLYEGDIVSIPEEENWVINKQSVFNHPHTFVYYIECTLNGLKSYVGLSYLSRLVPDKSYYDVLKEFSGKTIRITEAFQYAHDPIPYRRGLLSGKPITWTLCPRKRPGIRYKYEIVQ